MARHQQMADCHLLGPASIADFRLAGGKRTSQLKLQNVELWGPVGFHPKTQKFRVLG